MATQLHKQRGARIDDHAQLGLRLKALPSRCSWNVVGADGRATQLKSRRRESSCTPGTQLSSAQLKRPRLGLHGRGARGAGSCLMRRCDVRDCAAAVTAGSANVKAVRGGGRQWNGSGRRIGRPFGFFASRLSPPAPFHSPRSHSRSSTRAHSHKATSAFVRINSTTQQHDQRALVQAGSAAERIAASARLLVSASLLRSPRRPTRRRGLQTVLQLTRSVTAH